MPAYRLLCSFVVFMCLSMGVAYAEKPVLVLFPVQVGEADADYEAEFGSALQEGLQSRYKVFYGPAVEAELEKEYSKIDCDAGLCAQNVAIAFNGELIADASAKRLGNGYALKLVVSNVITNEIVESKTYPCRGCDGFAVIDVFKAIGMGKSNISSTAVDTANPVASSTRSSAVFIFDSIPSGAEVSINGRIVGKTPYQGLTHRLGESLNVILTKPFYKTTTFNAQLNSEITQLTTAVAMAAGEGKLLVTIEPYEVGVQLQVDSQPLGDLPKRVTLAAGRHNIKVIKDGKALAEKLVTVQDGSDEQWVIGAARGGVVQVGNTAFDMVAIPAGSFQMGGVENDEKPIHKVELKAFSMSKTEVSFAQWDTCVAAGGCSYKPSDEGWGRGNRPVVNLSYDDITKQFIPWLNSTTGKTFRLPSESEWEYTARAGSTTQYSWGDRIGNNNANCNGCSSGWFATKKTTPVGSFKPNAFGLLDMHGNVWEWTQDCFNDNYHGAPSDGSAWTQGHCDIHILRGGSWFLKPDLLRSANRLVSSATRRHNSYGFRLVQGL